MRLHSVDEALALLVRLGANSHLVQHHRLVAEAAGELVDALDRAGLAHFDRTEVVVGAALHDVGKVLHPSEMVGGGSEHEAAGRQLLRQHGLPEELARHAWTHANWRGITDVEPVLVALADTLWKGKRVAELEDRAATLLAGAAERDFWETSSAVDAICEAVGATGGDRLERSVQAPPA